MFHVQREERDWNRLRTGLLRRITAVFPESAEMVTFLTNKMTGCRTRCSHSLMLTQLTHGATERKLCVCAERSPSISPYNVVTTVRSPCSWNEETAPTFSTADSSKSRQQAACWTAAAENTVKVIPGTQLTTSDPITQTRSSSLSINRVITQCKDAKSFKNDRFQSWIVTVRPLNRAKNPRLNVSRWAELERVKSRYGFPPPLY